MIRSSIWGGGAEAVLESVPEGDYQVFIYVWEDNLDEQFDLLLNDKAVLENFHSGKTGSWKRLGPFYAKPQNGNIKLSARGGAANLSGLEVWSGKGVVPPPGGALVFAKATPENTEFFEKKIRPLLAANCYECHSAKAQKIGNHLLLDSRAGVVKGGDTGPLITPGLP
jgi:hypothetical protein